jgi:hypothetical protein
MLVTSLLIEVGLRSGLRTFGHAINVVGDMASRRWVVSIISPPDLAKGWQKEF